MAKKAPALTNKQKRFVAEYRKDANATQAAIRAGYSKKTADVQGPRLLGNVRVAAALEADIQRLEQRTEITRERVLLEMSRIGFADIRKVITWGETAAAKDEEGNIIAIDSVSIRDSKDIDDDTAAALAEVSQTKDGLKVKFHDKQAALLNIGKHLGMFPNKVELAGKDGKPIEVKSMSDIEMARKLLWVLEKAQRSTTREPRG